MNIEQFIDECIAHGISLSLDNENLSVQSEPGALTDEIIVKLKEYKPELINWLKQFKSDRIISNGKPTGGLPLSFHQQNLWLIKQLEGDTAHYNMLGALRITGKFDETFAEKAFQDIIRRHEILRSRFVETEEGAVQIVQEEVDFKIDHVDLKSFSNVNQGKKINEAMAVEASHSFEFEREPLIRVRIFRESDEQVVLVINMHHIISDGWSIKVLYSEFLHLYEAYRTKKSNTLSPLTIQYTDYSLWQREQLKGGILQDQLNWWVRRLKDIPQLHSIPLDKLRPKQQTFVAGCYERVLKNNLYKQISQMAARKNVSLFMLLQTAFALLLGKYSGEDDIIMGVPSAGRNRPELESLIGFFVNVLVFRTDLSGNPSFDDLLEQSKNNTLDAFANQDVPLGLLVEEINPKRDLSFNTLCQVKFLLEEENPLSSESIGFKVEEIKNKDHVIHFDLDLTILKLEQGLQFNWTYKKELFTSASIKSMASRFEHLLTSIVSNSNQKISELSLLEEKEYQSLIQLGKGADKQDSHIPSLIKIFESKVLELPDYLAVSQAETSLTYQQLNQKINRLADQLLEQEVEHGQRIAIFLERSPALVIAILATMKVGAVYIPLAPLNSKKRNSLIIEDADVDIVLTQDSLLDNLPIEGLDFLSLDGWQESGWMREYSSENPLIDVRAHDSAYIIYTSGSTGTPKGVEITHGGLLDYCQFSSNFYYQKHLQGSLPVTSHAFDITIPSLFLPLLNGGRIKLLPLEDDVLTLLAQSILVDDDNELLRMTPMHVVGLLSLLPQDFCSHSKHVFVIGGDVFPLSVAQSLQAVFPESQIYNHYGPTETVVGCSIYDVTANINNLQGVVPIGHAMDNHNLYVLDRELQFVPQGLVGELYIAGAGVAKGYINQAKLTASKFIKNPFGPGRLYATGDRVRWNVSGELEFLGRIDEQLSIMGYRIEPGEIESVLMQLKSVKEAVVIAKSDSSSQKLLSAYIVPTNYLENENTSSTEELKEYLLDRLPEYMVPTAFVMLKEMPMSENGKVNKSALPEIKYESRTQYIEPKTQTEIVVTKIWQEILSQNKLSITDNFFDLGGHSILATKVVSEVAKRLDKNVSIRSLFENSTIQKFSQYLDEQEIAFYSSIPRINRSNDLPLSFAQQRLWFINQLEGKSPQYNMPHGFKLTGKLNLPACKKVISEVINRHEILRTVYKNHEGEAYQFILQDFELPIIITDLSSYNKKTQEEMTSQIARTDALKPFDLENDLMLRFNLIKLNESEHLMLFNMHHIASDGWSMTILIKEFSALYNTYCVNELSTLAKLETQYADFARWQRDWLKGEFLNEQLSYWRSQLDGIPQAHNFPMDKARPAQQSTEGYSHNRTIDSHLTKKLKQFCEQHEITLHIFLLTAFSILIGRYSNEKDIVIGTSTAGRVHPDTQQLIGFFVNDLVLRMDLSGELSFLAFLGKTKETILSAHQHQYVPFEMLVEELKPERSLNLHPLFQIKMDIKNNDKENFNLHELNLDILDEYDNIIKYDLYLSVEEKEDTLNIVCQFNTDLFFDNTISKILSSYTKLLESISDFPNYSIHKLPILSKNEEQHLIHELNDNEVNYQQDKLFHNIFEELALNKPNNIAAIFENEKISYQELNEQSNRLANYLIDSGVKPDQKIIFYMDRSITYLVCMIGIWKAGACFIPLDPDAPRERNIEIIQQLENGIILCQEHYFSAASDSSDKPIIIFESVMKESIHKENPNHKIPPKTLAYIIFTSGSTGKPKGAMIEQLGMLNHLYAKTNDFNLVESDNVAQIATQVFDVHVWQFIVPLMVGAKVTIFVGDDAWAPEKMLPLIESHGITLIESVPAHFSSILDFLESENNTLSFPYLRCLIMNGEGLPIDYCRRWFSLFPDIVMANVYGPTECSDDITHFIFDKNLSDCLGYVPIGTPIGNMHLYVLNADLELQPKGAYGELYTSGAGVGRGYLNMPELTMSTFIDNPYFEKIQSNFDHSKLYKTGDLVRYLPSNDLEFISRIDQQVKIRGFRIELGEIEQQLLICEAVASCVVMAHQGKSNEKYLVAYVVLTTQDDESEITNLLRKHLHNKLPNYMIPSIFMVMDDWPLTPSGKIDKKMLPVPSLQLQQTEYVKPKTNLEKSLVDIWARVLKLDFDKLSVTENFFELGGHSLLAARLVSFIRKELEIECPIRLLFEWPTISGLSKQLSNVSRDQILPEIKALESRHNLPLSYAQQRIWFIDQFEEGSRFYNTSAAFRVSGAFDKSAFYQAVKIIVDRHEILRTVFPHASGFTYQHIKSDISIPIEEIDLRDIKNASTKIKELANENAQHLFDLSQDALINLKLLVLSDTDYVLLFCMHHIISDGWSLGIMIKEFSILYSAIVKNEDHKLNPLRIQYGDYAHWQRQWMEQNIMTQQLEYWLQQLDGIPQVHNLPMVKKHSSKQNFKGRLHRNIVDGELTSRIRNFCSHENVTLYMFLQASLSLLLHHYSNETDILTGTPVAGRTHADIEPLIGCFLNTLVIRANFSENKSFKSYLKEMKNTILDAYANQYIPFETLVEKISPERDPRYNPLCQVKFVIQNFEFDSLEMPNVSLSRLNEVDHDRVRFDLDLTVIEEENLLDISWNYKVDLFDYKTIENMANSFKFIIEAILDDPESTIQDINCIDEQHQALLFKNGRGEYDNDGRDICIHKLFEQQVIKTPNEIAAAYCDDKISYKLLNDKSNRLADLLLDEGIQVGDRVAICMSRSIELLISFLAVLKSGATYIPVDPNYSADRINYIVEDSSAKLVLSCSKFSSSVPWSGVDVVMLDDALNNDWLKEYNNTEPKSLVDIYSPAYIIYTSGSTGMPKGVEVTHQGLSDYCAFSLKEYYQSGLTGSLVVTSPSFDISIPAFYLPLLSGGCVELLQIDNELDALSEYFLKADYPNRLIRITPSHLKMILSTCEKNTVMEQQHVFIVGGEVFHRDIAVSLYEKFPNASIYNHYGPTETVVGCCLNKLSYQDIINTKDALPIGKPMSNTSLYVLSPKMVLLPQGVVGELYIGGPCVANGYVNQPELTKEKFVIDHFSKAHGAHLYKSGDLVRWRSDGLLEFIGRVDNQVKLNGHRIELEEVKSHLLKHSMVEDAVVLIKRSEHNGSDYLVAYIEVHDSDFLEHIDEKQSQQAFIGELKKELDRFMPRYLQPTGFIFLPEFPLTSNRKIDNNALLKLTEIRKHDTAERVAPRNKSEERLVDLWKHLLGIETIGVFDNFFDLGGHSLLVFQLINRVENEFGVKLKARDVFECYTVETLAERIIECTDTRKLTNELFVNSQELEEYEL